MKISKELYDRVNKAKQQKKGIVSFLQRQGYSWSYAMKVKNNWDALEIINKPIKAPANLLLTSSPSESESTTDTITDKGPPVLSMEETETFTDRGNVTVTISGTDSPQFFTNLLAQAIVNAGARVSSSHPLDLGTYTVESASSSVLKDYTFNIEMETHATSNA